MPPDERAAVTGDPTGRGLPSSLLDLPIDADLESLHAELVEAGEQARRMLYGRSQPTRLFSIDLRASLLGSTAAPAAGVGRDTGGRGQADQPEPGRGREWELVTPVGTRSPPPAETMIERPAATAPFRAVLALLAVAALLVVAALGGSLERLLG